MGSRLAYFHCIPDFERSSEGERMQKRIGNKRNHHRRKKIVPKLFLIAILGLPVYLVSVTVFSGFEKSDQFSGWATLTTASFTPLTLIQDKIKKALRKLEFI